MTDKRSHRSFVSYIDRRSRAYYAAQGYDEPYRWAHFDEVPFTRLPKPLDECRIGIATSADRGPRADGRQVRIYAEPHETAARLYTEMFWDSRRHPHGRFRDLRADRDPTLLCSLLEGTNRGRGWLLQDLPYELSYLTLGNVSHSREPPCTNPSPRLWGSVV